ncbi:MAG TPA: hypothetical protein VGS79_18370 [Puia sp.]|nr:hypothetical protein [Puia sp.]
MAEREEIVRFLAELKEKIRIFEIAFRPRDKNLQALADLDITAARRLECIVNLKVEDYFAGPKRDTYNTTLPDYYEFGIRVKGVEIYIKITKGLKNKPADCMSFHPAEFSITYPFKYV